MADDVKTGIRVVVEGEEEFEKDLGKVASSLDNAASAASSAETEINSANTATGSLASESAGNASSFAANMDGMSLAVIASIAGIVKVVSEVIEALDVLAGQTAEYGDGVQKGAQKLDFSTDAYQKWDYVLQKNGSSMKQAQGAITKLTENTAKGSDDTAKALDDLGISLEEAQEMSGEELFETVVSALQDIPDAGERAALASELMGGSYKGLGALLSSTGEETDALKQRAVDLGLVMSGEGVEAAVAYQDALEDMEATVEGIRRSLGEDLLPVIQPAKEALTGLLDGVDWAGLGSALAGALGPAVDFLNSFIIPIASVSLTGVVATLKLLLEVLGGIGGFLGGANLIAYAQGLNELGTIGDGHSLEEYAENVATAQEELAAAQQDYDNLAASGADLTEANNILNEKTIALQNATEEYERAKEALEGKGEGDGGEAPTATPEETTQQITESVAAAEEANAGMLEHFSATAGEISANYTAGVDAASQAAVEAIENTHSVMDENMAVLGTNAYIWGIDMMQKLSDGIVDGSNSLVLPAVDQLATEIKDRLGFSEPDKGPLSDFHTYAPDMMALFAQGIRDGRNLIAAAIGQSFDLGPMIAGQNAGRTLNYGGVSVQIYGAPGQSVDELYDVFSYRLSRDIADREAVFST